MDPWLFYGFILLVFLQQWQISSLKARVDVHRNVLGKIVDAINGTGREDLGTQDNIGTGVQ